MVSFGKTKSSNSSKIWDDQGSFLTDLYGKAQDLYGKSGPMNNFQNNYGRNTVMPTIGNINDNIMNDDFFSSIKSGTNLGMGSLAGMMDPMGNPYLGETIQNALTDLDTNFANNVMPGVNTDATNAGQVTGSRAGIAEGLARQELQKQKARTVTDMRSGAYEGDMNRALSAAGAYIGAGNTAASGEQAGYRDVINNLGAGYNLTMGMADAPWDDIMKYAQVLGGPTVLGEGSSSGFNFGFSPVK